LTEATYGANPLNRSPVVATTVRENTKTTLRRWFVKSAIVSVRLSVPASFRFAFPPSDEAAPRGATLVY
jgi:hypothetical protein